MRLCVCKTTARSGDTAGDLREGKRALHRSVLHPAVKAPCTHAHTHIELGIIAVSVLDFWDKHHDMRRRHVISPGISGHYQDLGNLSSKMHDSACNYLFLAWRLHIEPNIVRTGTKTPEYQE